MLVGFACTLAFRSSQNNVSIEQVHQDQIPLGAAIPPNLGGIEIDIFPYRGIPSNSTMFEELSESFPVVPQYSGAMRRLPANW